MHLFCITHLLPSPLAGEGLGVRGSIFVESHLLPETSMCCNEVMNMPGSIRSDYPSPPIPLPQGERGVDLVFGGDTA